MKTIDVVQGSEEWHRCRAGRVTASKVADLLAKTKTGWGASRANYAAQLVAERLTGRIDRNGYMNVAMQWGTDTEPEAREIYSLLGGVSVDPAGFVLHPAIEMSGCSPDGIVTSETGNGLVEIKCPMTAGHIETLLGGEVPGKYVKQMQWQMACCELPWCDFVSYDPRMPAEMQLFVRRVDRDDKLIAEMEKQVVEFLDEVDQTVASLVSRYSIKASSDKVLLSVEE